PYLLSRSPGFKMGLKLQSFRNFDAFPRAEEHLLQKTPSGAVGKSFLLILSFL
ncbi:hypothetical protein BHE74_00006643, partial [Ensete ventricosum]